MSEKGMLLPLLPPLHLLPDIIVILTKVKMKTWRRSMQQPSIMNSQRLLVLLYN